MKYAQLSIWLNRGQVKDHIHVEFFSFRFKKLTQMYNGEVQNSLKTAVMVMYNVHTTIKNLGATKKRSKFYQHNMLHQIMFIRIVMKKKWYASTQSLERLLKNSSYLNFFRNKFILSNPYSAFKVDRVTKFVSISLLWKMLMN